MKNAEKTIREQYQLGEIIYLALGVGYFINII